MGMADGEQGRIGAGGSGVRFTTTGKRIWDDPDDQEDWIDYDDEEITGDEEI